jgi:hypothetical protein
VAASVRVTRSLYLRISRCISLYLPISPYISYI